MFAEQRKSIILDLLKTNSSVSLNELMDTFNVSETTIRRDLTDLENIGMLKRTHGGAVSNTNSVFEPNYLEKESKYSEEKKSIAKIVAEMVNDGDTVLLDAGTTTAEIACMLSDKNIILITNSAIITSDFLTGQTNMEIHSTGGLFRSSTKSFVGPAAENYLRHIRPDKAFIAVNGISLETGATTPHISEASIKKTMISISKEVYFVVDHSKFGKEYFSVIESVDAVDGIITDDGINQGTIEQFRQRDIPIITNSTYDTDDKKGEVDMNISEILKPENITLKLKSGNREDAIKELISFLVASSIVSDQEEMYKAVMKREEEFSTGIGMGIAIPHAKSKYVTSPAIAFGLCEGVDWPSEDDEKAKMIFLIAVPMEAQNQHLRLLAQISRKLVHENIRDMILNASEKQEIINALE